MTVPTSTLFGWWKADDLSGTHSNGDNVTSWTDAQNSHVLSTGTYANAPSYEASSVNGQPGVYFDLANTEGLELLSPALMDGVTGGSVYMVIRQDSTASGGAYLTPLTISKNTIYGTRFSLYQNSSTVEVAARRLDSDSYASTTASGQMGYPDPAVLVAWMNWSTGKGTLKVNGTALINNVSVTSTGSTSSTNSYGLHVGVDTDAGFWDGAICEILVYESVLSSTDNQSVLDYLSAKYFNQSATGSVGLTPSFTASASKSSPKSGGGAADLTPVFTAGATVTKHVSAAADLTPVFTTGVTVTKHVSGAVDLTPSFTATGSSIAAPKTGGGAADLTPSFSGSMLRTGHVSGALDVTPVFTGSMSRSVTLTGSVDLSPSFTASANAVRGCSGSVAFSPVFTGSAAAYEVRYTFTTGSVSNTTDIRWFNDRLQGVSVWKTGGVWTERQWISQIEQDAADVVYLGGRKHTVTAAEKTDLEAAGYTVDTELVQK